MKSEKKRKERKGKKRQEQQETSKEKRKNVILADRKELAKDIIRLIEGIKCMHQWHWGENAAGRRSQVRRTSL